MDTDSDNAKMIETLLRLGAQGWYVCDYIAPDADNNRPHGLHWCALTLFDGGAGIVTVPRCSANIPAQATKYVAALHDDQPKCYECAVLYLATKEKLTDG